MPIYIRKFFFFTICLMFVCKVYTYCPTHHVYFEEDEYFDKNYLQCAYTPLTPVIAINNYKNIMTEYKPFSSACAQCAICLTIAEKLNKLFESFHKNGARIIKTENEINGKIKKMCDVEFLNYDFQKDFCLCSNRRNYKCANEIAYSNEAGLWPVKLNEACYKYIASAGEYDLYKRWFQNSDSLDFNMSDLLCRSYGIFQHCRNVLSDQ